MQDQIFKAALMNLTAIISLLDASLDGVESGKYQNDLHLRSGNSGKVIP